MGYLGATCVCVCVCDLSRDLDICLFLIQSGNEVIFLSVSFPVVFPSLPLSFP